MALKLLQPGIQPLGQFDLDDNDANSCVGGQIGMLAALDLPPGDGYAADVGAVGPRLQVELGTLNVCAVDAAGLGAGFDDQCSGLWGLADEGAAGYGTLFGTVIGGTAGQGTGFGAQATQGVVVVGPQTNLASGKCTLWTMPGLYGLSPAAYTLGFNNGGDTAAAAALIAAAFGLNDYLDGHANGGTAVSGTLEVAGAVDEVAVLHLGAVSDPSLVSTTSSAVGLAADTDYFAAYCYGPHFT
jgi:hypothetical protein